MADSISESINLVRRIELPALCLVVMIGSSGSGKTTFARKHFLRTEILSSDYFRGLVSDNENEQAATKDAFDALYFIADRRLVRRRLTVIDATNVRPEDRRGFVRLASRFNLPAIAIVLDMPQRLCFERNEVRLDRNLSPSALCSQFANLVLNLPNLEREGFSRVHIFSAPGELEAVEFVRV